MCSNFKIYRVLVFTVFVFLCLQLEALSKKFIYLFSEDAKFIKIDSESGKIVDVGNLWYLSIGRIYGLKQFYKKNLILVNTPTFKIKPSNLQSYESRGLAVLEIGKKGIGLYQPKKVFDQPDDKYMVESFNLVENSRDMVFINWEVINWDDSKEYKGQNEVVEGDNFNKILKVDLDYPVLSDNRCFSRDGKKLVTPVLYNKKFSFLNLDTLEVEQRPFSQIGSEKYFSKTIVGSTNNSCKFLFHEYREKPKKSSSAKSYLYLYDLDNDRIESEFILNYRGEYNILQKRNVTLINEYIKLLVESPDGSVVGKKKKQIGKLHFYDYLKKKEVAVMDLPENGRIVRISPDEKKAYYISPYKLTIIDLDNYKVLKSIDIPFPIGIYGVSDFIAIFKPEQLKN